MKKSQTSIEFIILLGFAFFFFIVFFAVIQGNMSDKVRENQNQAMKEAALSVRDEINLAHESSNGYQREFQVPQDLAGKDYNINITENMVYLRTLDGKNSIALPVAQLIGNVQKSSNIIRKQNNTIYLNI